jgi:uncharacterized protein YceH (UPF0502 family)
MLVAIPVRLGRALWRLGIWDALPGDEFQNMDWKLNAIEARVLGSLIEKAVSTPEYYPLSLNALVNACNQKSNRDPFLTLEEDEVRQALHTLGDKRLASGAPSTGRVAKFEHRLPEVFNLGRGEEAILCVLLLRGPQTPGELRARAERLFAFDDVAEVQSALEQLMRREPALATAIPRQPGTKETRYAHLLSGDIEALKPLQIAGAANQNAPTQRPALEEEVARLREESTNFVSRSPKCVPLSAPVDATSDSGVSGCVDKERLLRSWRFQASLLVEVRYCGAAPEDRAGGSVMIRTLSKFWQAIRQRLRPERPEPQDPYSRVRVPLHRGPSGLRSAAVALEEPAEYRRLRFFGRPLR